MIHIPRKNLILPPNWRENLLQYMDPMVPKTRMRGRYKLSVVRSDGSIARETPWFDNVITNGGLDLYGTNPSLIQYCHVGTGSTVPAVTDTGLTTWLASTNTTTTGSAVANGTSPYMAYTQVTYRFPAGTATGNLSEVGVGAASGNTSMFSHALILDGGGSPTTITVLSTEALDVTYQIQNYPPLVDVGGSVTLSGTTYTTNMRSANAGGAGYWALGAGANALDSGGLSYGSAAYSTQTLGAITATPAGTSITAPAPVLSSYTNGNYYRDATINCGLTDVNCAGGIGSMTLVCGSVGRAALFQCSFTPVIPKDASHIMSLVIRHAWARYP